MENISTFVYYRDDVLALAANSKFSVAKWRNRFIKRNRIYDAITDIRVRFGSRFDICEEYRLTAGFDGIEECIYKICALGKDGEVGFMFAVNVGRSTLGMPIRERIAMTRKIN